MEKRWNIVTADANKVTALQKELGINPVLCKILVQRGLNTFDASKNYFRPQLTDLHSPWLMKDMQKAVDRIVEAFTNHEKILVFGDYDVDGTTSVACMYHFLTRIYDSQYLDFYIPHRYREGYGVSKAGIDFAKEQGFSLIISLDCGIKSADLIAYAKELGIDFVVCDHHLPDKILPPAVAILNPKQTDCTYPYKELCGCGVGFKLISALCEYLNLEEHMERDYFDLIATAIAADIVPMTGENRIIAYYGLEKANKNPNAGIKALIKLSGLTKEMHITNLVFMIAPRVNAAGRMDDARKAVELFLATSEEKAMQFAEMLHNDNTDRKEADKQITEEALTLIESNSNWKERKTTVVYQPHWHKGVVGIVASRLIEHYYRPTIVLTQSGDYAAGSGRSVPGFNLYEAIHACKEYLLGYGGHFAAAGMTLLPEQIIPFSNRFEEVVSATIEPHLLSPQITIDAEVNFTDLQPTFYKILCQMEPFGPENMRPVFLVRNVTDNGWSKIVKEEHLKVSLQQNGVAFNGIGFGMANKYSLLKDKKPVDVVFTLDLNEWNGNTSLQLKLIDLKPSPAQ